MVRIIHREKEMGEINAFEIRYLESVLKKIEREEGYNAGLELVVLNDFYLVQMNGKRICDPIVKTKIMKRIYDEIEKGALDFEVMSKLFF